MKEPVLKPCPFCGGRAVYNRTNAPYLEHAMWSAACSYGHAWSPDMESKKDAAEWWNRREKKK